MSAVQRPMTICVIYNSLEAKSLKNQTNNSKQDAGTGLIGSTFSNTIFRQNGGRFNYQSYLISIMHLGKHDHMRGDIGIVFYVIVDESTVTVQLCIHKKF